jgi:hypothetical protein
MKLVSSEKQSHWYTKEGEPCHTIIGKTTGQPRNVTVKDARELGLLPSVTTIMNVLARPELEAWKQEQCILSALTLPRIDGESDDAFAKRVVIDSGETGKQAAIKGSNVHDYIEALISKSDTEGLAVELNVKEACHTWVNDHITNKCTIVKSEFRTADIEAGYAGCIDLYHVDADGIATLIDFKTQSFKGKKPTFYDTYLYQLCAYKQLLEAKGLPVHNIVNVVIQIDAKHDEDVQIVSKVYNVKEIHKGTNIFNLLKALFKTIKDI